MKTSTNNKFTVADLILELKHLPPNLQVILNDFEHSKVRKQHEAFEVSIVEPEYADNYVSIAFNFKA